MQLWKKHARRAAALVCTLALTFAAARCAREGYKYR